MSGECNDVVPGRARERIEMNTRPKEEMRRGSTGPELRTNVVSAMNLESLDEKAA